MKNLNWILHALSIALIGYLLFQNHKLNSCCTAPKNNVEQVASSVSVGTTAGNIAYFNSDSLLNNLKFFKENEQAFKKKQDAMVAELKNKEANLQNELRKLQENAQNLTRKEGEAAQEKLARMEQDLMARKDKLSEQFAIEQDEFNEKLHQKVTSYLNELSADKKYNFVFSVARGGNIFYSDSALDITAQMIKALNEKYSN